jgi:hypothetical protein
VVLHVAAIWVVRSLYFHSSLLAALIDCGLSGLAACGLAWAAVQTGSVFVATWTFFLVQSFFVAVPPAPGRSAACPSRNESFARARRQADAALRVLARRS